MVKKPLERGADVDPNFFFVGLRNFQGAHKAQILLAITIECAKENGQADGTQPTPRSSSSFNDLKILDRFPSSFCCVAASFLLPRI